jgi:hypothetical protein
MWEVIVINKLVEVVLVLILWVVGGVFVCFVFFWIFVFGWFVWFMVWVFFFLVVGFV